MIKCEQCIHGSVCKYLELYLKFLEVNKDNLPRFVEFNCKYYDYDNRIVNGIINDITVNTELEDEKS